MFLRLSIFLLLTLAWVCPSSPVKYDGEQVWHCLFADRQQALDFPSLAESLSLDIWHLSWNSTDVRGPRSRLSSLPTWYSCSVHVDDVQQLLDQRRREDRRHLLTRRSLTADNQWFEQYHRFEEIVDYVTSLAARFPELTELVPSIGQTVEGRDIPALRIRASYPDDRDDNPPTKTVVLTAGIHAREWISITTVLYLATKLLENAGQLDTELMLTSLEFVVVPVVNPDGYVYSWDYDRFWRKNRQPAPKSAPKCVGVDLNRNFDNHWGGVGASPYPCASDYRGASVASEPETQALQKFVLSLPNRSAAIDFHSYGQLILRSFGYTKSFSPNEAILAKLGNGMRETIKAMSGSTYKSEKASDLYPTTGSTDDWFTEAAGMWGWTIELRDVGVSGFNLPASSIAPTGEEIWQAMRYFAMEVIANGPVSN